MCINVGDHKLRDAGKILLIGSCMNSRFPEIIDQFRRIDGNWAVLHVCLEETHMNQAGFKIGSIVSYSNIERIIALTIDGSPHCVQLHFVIEDVKMRFMKDLQTEHFVVEKGKVVEVHPSAVKRARHLSKIRV
ncbi:MAG: 4Fe-4S ferredoxin [Candidatus Hodarchaeota archaeon]